jgi:uroporphyrinogen-III synthase
MRVAIFRPEPQASRMAERLRASGVETVVAPMLVVQSADDPVGRILSGDRPAALFVTSQNAIHALSRDPRLGEVLAVPVVAVGTATADAARLAGFGSVLDAAGDGPAAVQLIETHFGSAGGRVVWVAGSKRSDALDDRLRRIGFAVDVVIAYHAEARNCLDSDMIAALMEGRINIVVIASARTAASLQAALVATGLVGRMGATRLVAISEAAARPLAGSFAAVEIAARADGDALIDAVLRSGREELAS